MRCPRCQHNNSRVIDSRQADDGRAIRRRRECENCSFRFTTFERIEAAPLLVIKKNGEREEFNRDKILRGLIRSAEKRPVAMEQMEQIVNHVENRVRSLGENEVSTNLIGEYVMEDLVDLDEIAYIRFASVYRQFKDMSVFLKELQDIVDKAKENAEKADLIIYVVDASRPLDENDHEIIEMIRDKKAVILLNKSDLSTVVDKKALETLITKPMIDISAKEETGIHELESTLKEMFYHGDISFNDEVYITNIRHKTALADALSSLKKVEESIENQMPEDFFTIDLMDAYESLGSITGETIGEDLVNEIFSKFCMGK